MVRLDSNRLVIYTRLTAGPCRLSGNGEDGRLARPSIPTPPGTDGTIGLQGPAVLTGRLGTLDGTL